MSRTPTSLREIRVAPGRVLKATPVFDTYWRFASRRQELFMRRVGGAPPPWTPDPVLATYRFTNAYRASDRVSQYLIRNVIYRGDQTTSEICFRTLLFKFFNRIDTWEAIQRELGTPTWASFNIEHVARVLDRRLNQGSRIYSAAYIMPSPPFGSPRKHRNHLRLLVHMMRGRFAQSIERARSLSEVFELLRGYPSIGDFLAFQFAIDVNYGPAVNFSEMDFVVAGPGARDGIRKCFADTGGLNEADVIRAVAERADDEFKRLGLPFSQLWGRPLQLIDCQNLFCEVDKYARVAHPEFSSDSGRTRIKQRFAPKSDPLLQWYPPKWKLGIPSEFTDRSVTTPGEFAVNFDSTATYEAGGTNSMSQVIKSPRTVPAP